MMAKTPLEKKLAVTLRRLDIDATTTVLVGVSGGADSLALLDALVRLRDQSGVPGTIHAMHVNHQLRGAEADEDWQFVQRETAQRNVLLSGTVIDVAARAQAEKRNLEAVARAVRYEYFHYLISYYFKGAIALTAHTFDDQVETILLRLLRGTSAAGLAATHERRALAEGVVVLRPLLDVTRAEVLEHCAHYGVEFREDSSNASLDFARNRIRHELLPHLRTFNPHVGTALTRLAAQVNEDDQYLQVQAAELLAQASATGKALVLASWQVAPATLRRRVLRLWLARECGDLRRLGQVHLAALDALGMSGHSGQHVELPYGWRVVREFNTLQLLIPIVLARQLCFAPLRLADNGAVTVFGRYELSLNGPLPLAAAQALQHAEPAGLSVCLPAECADGLSVRSRLPGDAYVPVGRKSAVKVKALLIQHKIGVTQRAEHPLVVGPTGEILWSPRLPVAQLGHVSPAAASTCVLVIARERCNLFNMTGVSVSVTVAPDGLPDATSAAMADEAAG